MATTPVPEMENRAPEMKEIIVKTTLVRPGQFANGRCTDDDDTSGFRASVESLAMAVEHASDPRQAASQYWPNLAAGSSDAPQVPRVVPPRFPQTASAPVTPRTISPRVGIQEQRNEQSGPALAAEHVHGQHQQQAGDRRPRSRSEQLCREFSKLFRHNAEQRGIPIDSRGWVHLLQIAHFRRFRG